MATVRLQLRRGTEAQWDAANPTLAAGEIGIETDTNTFKFGDGSTAWNSLSYALSQTVDDYILLNTKGVANGVASLDSSGFIPSAQLPPLAKVTVSAVANQGARLALTAEAGDIAIQADNGQSYVLSSSPASTDANWKALVGSEAVVDTVEASLIAGTGLDKTYNDTDGTITIDIDSTVATKTYADQAATTAISTASSDATTKANAAASGAASALSSHEADTTNVHGIADTSILVTTSGTQTLTNKTLTSPAINTPTGITKSDVGLANVDNTSDADKPISLAALSALGLKAPLNSPALTGDATAVNLTLSGNLTVNGTTSTINSTTLTIQDKDIVLGQTATPTDAAADQGGIILKGTADKSMRYSLAKSAWDFSENINIPGDKAVKINNIDVLTVSTVLGKTLPGVVVGTTETQTLSGKTLTSPTMTDPVISGTVALPLTTSVGNVSQEELQSLNGVTSSIQDQFSLKAPLADPTFTGTVSGITKAMIGLGSADNTADTAKPVSTATQTALDLKAPLASPTFTGTVGLPASTSIGTASADEIATLNGATSNIQAQIDLKAPIASPTFTGTVNGITKAMVGLTNVNDTSDAAKPISTAAQTALDLKAPLASPTFTGTVSLPSTTSIGNISAIELDLLNGANSNIQGQIDLKAPLASPTFTGTVTLPSGTITSGMISDGAVATADIENLAVSTAKIADASVTEAKLANDSVTTGKIAANTIVNADISLTAEIATSKISGLDTALGLKAPLASPTFTGTVSGVTKSHVGLENVDNTADTAKPVSTAQATAIATAKSEAIADATSQVNALLTGAPAALNTLDELAAALGDDANFASTVTTNLAAKAPLASPTFTGTVTVAAAGVAFTDGTQTKAGIPSLTTIGTEIAADYNLSTGGLALRDQLIPIAGTRAISVPTNATTAFPIGTSIDFYQASGTGANFVEISGVTILRTPGLKLRTTYSSATLTKVATNTWLLAGDLTA